MAGNSNLENLLVPELAKLGTKAKSSFTRAHNDLDIKLQNLKQCLTSLRFEEDARQSLLVVRERYERVVSIYDEIQSKVSDEIWEATYSAKMGDVETKKGDSETKQATVFVAARKAVEEHEARLNESIAVPRAGETGGAAGGSQNWKLESSFAPKKEASSEMTMEELGIWLRTFEAYR